MEHLGAAIMGAMMSPLRGADGNVEFLLHLVVGASAHDQDPLGSTSALDAAVDEARTAVAGR